MPTKKHSKIDLYDVGAFVPTSIASIIRNTEVYDRSVRVSFVTRWHVFVVPSLLVCARS